MQKILPIPLVLLAFCLSFIAIYGVQIPLFQDFDIGWHIVAGDFIRANGAIPMHDPWSFTEKLQVGGGQVWYNLSWLWDICLSIIHQKTGIEGLYIFAKLCPAILVGLQVYYLKKRGNIGNNAIIFTAMITTFCMMEFAYGRPQILGLIFLLIFQHLLHKRKSLYILPVLMVIWANVHGSFFTAFVPLGAYGLEAIYTRNWKWLKTLLFISFLCLLAVIINPYGIYIFMGVWRTLHSVITKYITEWQPFVFGGVMGASMWVLVFIYASNLRTSSAPLADKILALLCLFAMFFSVRNIGLLAVLGAPYLAANMPPDDANDKHTKKLTMWAENKRFSPIFAAFIPLILIAGYFLLPILSKDFYMEDPKKSPKPAIDYVTSHYAGKNMLNDYNLGGRIIYETNGKFPLFIDGRAGSAYSEKVLTDYLAFMNLEDDWQKNLAPYKIDVILVQSNSSFANMYKKGLYHDDWKQVFHDDAASVYERKLSLLQE